MDGHLVAIEVRVEWGAHKRRNLDGLIVDKHWLKGLNGQAVECRRSVEQDDVALDHPLQRVPHLGSWFFHQVLGHLHAAHDTLAHEPVDDMWLEQLKGHLLGDSALTDLELRAGHDDCTP